MVRSVSSTMTIFVPGRATQIISLMARVLSVKKLMPPAWKTDAVNGDQSAGGGAGTLAAVAGYPHLTVPMGLVKGLPIGLSFIGPKWSEALLLSLGYSYEQARGPFPAPKFYQSIEQSPQIAPYLKPLRP